MRLPGSPNLSLPELPRRWPALSWAALVVSDRRWAASLSAMALGFGLFAGVALGPGSDGSQARGTQVVQVAPADPPAEPADAGGGNDARSGGGALTGGSPPAGTGSIAPAPLAPAPLAPPPLAPAPAPAPEESPPSEPAPGGEPADDPDPGQRVEGTVVHVNRAASSYGIVVKGGLLYSVHAKDLPAAGAKVSAPVRVLANGTYAEDGERKQSGRADGSRFDGVVTFVDDDPQEPAYAVSRLGVSVLVRVEASSEAAARLPELGSFIDVTVAIRKPEVEEAGQDPTADPSLSPPPDGTDGVASDPSVEPDTGPSDTCPVDRASPALGPVEIESALWERSSSVDGEPFAYSDFAGIVQASCPETGELVISADDVRAAGDDLLLAAPAAIDLARVKAGESIAATANIGDDGRLELAGLASDEKIAGADDQEALQGDLAGG